MKQRIALLCTACLLALPATGVRSEVQVGVAAAVNQAAEGEAPGAGKRTLTLGDTVIHDEHIATGPDGLVNILLVDGTSFTVGANSDLTIDSFVYDPDAGTAKVVATLAKGALRFIGGRTSKTGGATINTPVGTVGIRGGVGDFSIGEGDGSNGVPPNLVNCVFGTCSVTDSNGTVTNFDQGQSVYPNGGGGYTVVPTTPAMAAAGTSQVGSAPGKTGGASQQKTQQINSTVNNNGTGVTNSGGPPPNNPPTDIATNSPGTTNDVVQDANPTIVIPKPIVPNPLSLRVLTSPEVYETNWGSIPSDEEDDRRPAELGLVGGDAAGRDQNVTLTFAAQPNHTGLFAGSGDLTETPITGAVVLPAHLASGFHSFSTSADAVAPFSPLGAPTGAYYLNTDGQRDINFAFFELFYNDGEGAAPFYAIGGKPTDFQMVFKGDDVRRYTFTEDPIQNVPVPFFRAGLIDDFSGAAISDIYVVKSPDLTGEDPQHVRLLQAWLQISGTGSEQQSAIGVTAGDFDSEDGDPYQLSSGRRGSYRSNSTDTATLFYGPLKSLEGPSGNSVFGGNGENFVLTSDVTGNDPFGDNSINDGANFSTVHVANLVSETAQSPTQSDHTLFGFTSGMVEETRAEHNGVTVSSMFSGLPDLNDEGGPYAGFRIQFNADGNNLGGDLTVEDQFDTSAQQSLHLSFGDGYDHQSDDPGGSSVYLDDTLFAADTQGPDQDGLFPHSYATKDNGSTLVYLDGEFPVTFIVSSGAVDLGPNPAFMGGTEICTCSFLEWGWWGAQPRLALEGSPNQDFLTQSIHLGTWVAGDIVDSHDTLDAAAEAGMYGSATYTGFAIGTVLTVDPNDGSEGDPHDPILSQYIAGGGVSLTWHFGERTGEITFDFDGKTFGGIVGDPGSSGALFAGDLYGDQLAGSVNGAFVSSTTTTDAGFIGDFGIYGVNYSATGIIAGEKNALADPTALNTISFNMRVLTSGDEYTPNHDPHTIDDPGSVGLVGNGSLEGEGGHDFVTTVTLGALSLEPSGAITTDATFTVGATEFTLPFELTDTSYSQAINETFVDGTMIGTAYFGPGAFAAYLTDFDGQLFYAVTGIPTEILPKGGTGVFEGGGVRAYDLSEDPVQQIPVPFMRDISAFNYDPGDESDPANYVSTPLYVVNEHADNGFAPHVLQTWLTIEGSGAEQVSGIGVEVSVIYDDPGDGIGFGLNAGRRGSFRADAEYGSSTLGGSYSTLGGPNDGANQFFGPNAENFLVGTGGFSNGDTAPNVPEAIGDFSLDSNADAGVEYGTVHVATLEDTPIGVGEDRTERLGLTGFTAGLVDVAYQSGCSAPNEGCSSWDLSQALAKGGPQDHQGIVLNLDPSNDRLGGTLVINGVTPEGSGSLTLEFGRTSIQDSGEGKSTFVDDNIYAARESAYPEHTTAVVDGNTIYQRVDDQANTYVVSSGAVALDDPAFMGGAAFCQQCDFIEWGWWGTTVRFADPTNPNDSIFMATHLGNWVAGDIVSGYTVLPELGEATYSGHAVGTVVASIGEGTTVQYVAGGDFDLTWDFGSRTGLLAINNFDGRDFGGAVADNGADFAGFSGDLFGSGLTGTAEGAFVNNGDTLGAGVIGNFGVASEAYSATGIFLGANVPLPASVGQSLTSLTGFAAGFVDAEVDGAPSPVSPIAMQGSIDLNFTAGAPGTMSGSILVANGDTALSADFGGSGSSVYVDDDVFAAVAGNDSDAAVTLEETVHQASGKPSTYVASANAVSHPNVSAPDANCTDCSFMKWGWWGTEVKGNTGGPEPQDVRASTHLGTWVAGNMPDPSDLPTSGSAEYDGGAIGTVNNAGAQYAASGDMHMDWNFGDRSGDWNVSNFDGKNFGASNVSSLADTSTFSGAVDTGDATGTMSGAFASNGADASAAPAGVMGSFGVTDGGDWSATGTFMGELVPPGS